MTDEPTINVRVEHPAATGSRREMLPKPEGMSRQTHRRAYKRACAIAKVDPQFARPTDKRERRRLRKQLGRLRYDATPRGSQNRSSKVRYLNLP